MGLIEEAGQRLQQLKNAGVEMPAPTLVPAHALAVARPAQERSAHRVERIDLDALAAAGFITPSTPPSRLANEFRIVKRALLANAAPRREPPIPNGNVIMVTSSVPGEGKSFAALNLAMSIAMELDHTVLLVDADVARPALPALMRVPEGPGLLDALLRPELDPGHFVAATNVDKLEFMPVGTRHPRASEMLASDAMSALVQRLGSRRDRIVVFDSPPLLATTEAAVLARHMGQVLFVVAAGSTPVHDVERALPTIAACPNTMLLLNRVSRFGEPMTAYGYDYGYGA
ncbi:MAG TPA: P-loop NTPase [Usitatibacter sp.]|nr:P-loop NTPase [Usitatibacter sp.]